MVNQGSVERFLKIRGQSIAPRNKARILYGIAFSLTRSELAELRWQVGARLRHFRELDAPAVIIENQIVIDKRVYKLLDKAEHLKTTLLEGDQRNKQLLDLQ